MLQEFYLNKLYPLQDKALKIISSCDSAFYLTGDTALGRYYLNHRYSDDLDLFVNRNPDFRKNIDIILKELNNYFKVETALFSEDFVRMFISDNDTELKIEFVNDVGYHSGGISSAEWFNRIDSWQNILSNKLTAIQRDAAKDYADIIFLSLSFDFEWKQIFEEAKKKDNWVNELEVVNAISLFDDSKIKSINWVISTEEFNFKKLFHTLAKDILQGKKNSLAGMYSISNN